MIGSQISDLKNRNRLPPELATLAFRVNDLRIIGAHVKPRDLNAKHIPLLENLIKALFESLYSGPYHVEQAKKALQSLTRRKRKRKIPAPPAQSQS